MDEKEPLMNDGEEVVKSGGLQITKDLRKRIRIEAAVRDMDMKEAMAEALELWLMLPPRSGGPCSPDPDKVVQAFRDWFYAKKPKLEKDLHPGLRAALKSVLRPYINDLGES